MGLSIRSLGKKLTELGSKAYDQANVFDNNRTWQQRAPTQQKSVFQQAGQIGGQTVRAYAPVTRVIGNSAPARNINTAGRFISSVANAVPEISPSSPARFLNNLAIRPYKTTEGNLGEMLQGNNPYSGSMRQQAGQATQDIINAASVIPVGKGVQLAQRGLPAVRAGLKSGAGIGAGFGAAQGVSTSLQNELGFKDAAKTTAISTGIGAGIGGALGVAAPILGAGIRNAPNAAKVVIKDEAGYLQGSKPNVKIDPTEAIKDAAAYRAARDIKKASLQQPTGQKVKNSVASSAFDPRNVEQKLDNVRFRNQKERGLTQKGQREQLPEESLAWQRGRIQNPYKPAEVRANKKYVVNGEKISLNKIIKQYGKDDSPKAKAFEDYRLYKDELENLSQGKPLTMAGHDPRVMEAYVKRYEVENPNAVKHNAVLRESELEKLRERVAAGIDKPELLAIAEGRKFYNPRTSLAPDDLVKPKIVGGVRSGAKGTQARAATTGGETSSPLSLFRKNNEEHERALAQQRYDSELVRRIEDGDIDGKIAVDAKDVIVRKQLLAKAKEISTSLKKTVGLARDTRQDLRVATVKKNIAEANAKKAARTELKKVVDTEASRLKRQAANLDKKAAGGKVKASVALKEVQRREKAAASKAKEILKKETTDPDARAAIDSMSNRELLEVLNTSVANAGKGFREAKGVRSGDKAAVNAAEKVAKLQEAKADLLSQIPDPEVKMAINALDDNELLSVFRAISDDTETGYYGGLKKSLDKKQAAYTGLVREVENLRAQIARDADEAAALRSGATQFNNKVDKNSQAVNYKVDGEVGKLILPQELITSLSKQSDQLNKSYLEKGLTVPATAQKLFWTGFMQPAFKVWNVAKNPLLMYRNGDALSGINPATIPALLPKILNTEKLASLKDDFIARGMSTENILQTRNVHKTAVDDIVRRSSLGNFLKGFVTNPARSIGDLGRGLGAGLASLDNAQRYAVAYGAYKRAKGLGYPEEVARDMGAQAPAKVLGDFDRVTRLAQSMEAIIPYTGATQAGTRALARASRTKPVETAFKDATLIGGMAGLTAYSLSNAGEYYQDMIDSGKEYVLDNNWTIALPWAERKIGDDGKPYWDGVISIGITPDFRPTNRAVWRTVRNLTNGEGVDKSVIAGEMFNQITGDSSSFLFDEGRTDDHKNLANGVLPNSPLATLGKTATGISVYDGNPLSNEYQQTRPRTEQANASTSDGAKKLSGLLGGLLTPLQADQILGQMGNTGDVIQAQDDAAGITLQSFVKPLRPGKPMSDAAKSGRDYYKDYDTVGKGITDERTYREFQAKHTKDETKSLLNSATNALGYLNNPGLYEADKKLDTLARKRGEKGNPLYDLTPEQTQKVLTYRSGKIYNSAGQNKDKNGESSFTALGLDEKWYDDYKSKETAYYDDIAAKTVKSALASGDTEKIKQAQALSTNDDYSGFSGRSKPKASPELQKKMDYYYTLGKGTGQRKAFLNANPDILEFWASSNDFTDAERIALGFNPIKEEDSSSGFASRGGSGSGGSSQYGSLDPYKYAVSLNAGGSIAKPKVTVKKAGAAPTKKSAKRAAPKVSIKKSLV